jgi:hypothetical protein
VASQENTDCTELKRTVQQLEKDLLHEKARVSALSEELSRPMNVHRWRILESSDPQKLELVQKVQSLQKQIITKAAEVSARVAARSSTPTCCARRSWRRTC